MPCYFCPYLLVLVILLWSFLLIFLSWSFGPRFLSCLLSWFFLSVFLSCLLSFLCHGLSVLFFVMVYLSCSVSWYFFLFFLPRLFVLFIWTCYYCPGFLSCSFGPVIIGQVFFPVLIFLSCSDLSIPCAHCAGAAVGRAGRKAGADRLGRTGRRTGRPNRT